MKRHLHVERFDGPRLNAILEIKPGFLSDARSTSTTVTSAASFSEPVGLSMGASGGFSRRYLHIYCAQLLHYKGVLFARKRRCRTALCFAMSWICCRSSVFPSAKRY